MSPSATKEITDEVPILIIGGGPSGLLLAFMLAKFGIPTLITERYPTRLSAPKVHALSPRSLEICRQFGLDVNAIRRLGTSRDDAYWVNFITSLGGEIVGRLPYERMDGGVLDETPAMIHNVPQPDFEDFVAGRLGRLVEVRKGHSFVRLEEWDDCVVTTIEDRSNQREYTVKSKHVVACDGAKSAVRRYLGIESEGEDSFETMMTIHINADLRPVVKDRVGMLHWVMDPEVAGFIIGYDLPGNQVLICNFDSTKHPNELWNEALCRKTVNAAIGKDIPYQVLSYRPWILSRKVAKAYRAGKVFLAGDAAHSFPPTGGLGLNSGLGDVHNLAYKLAAVHQGWGGDKLLSSYEYDRRQVALVNSEQSVKNGKKIFGLLKALGTTDPDVTVARKNLYRNLSNPKAMEEINERIEGQGEHFDNLGLHIGYVYGDRRVPSHASVYRPVCVPGARLPHTWIRFLDSNVQALPAIDSSYVKELSDEEVRGKQFSTLDLCPLDALILLVDQRVASAWDQCLGEVRCKIPSSLKVNLVVRGIDFDLESGKCSDEWMAIMKLKDGRAVLIRPDQHILACFEDARTEDILDTLHDHLAW